MKHRFTLLFALLCASMMGWAYTSNPDTWIGTTDATYADQFKWSVIEGVNTPNDVVNIQKLGFASAIGIYMTFQDAGFDAIYMNGVLTANGTDYAQQGAGIVVYLSALTSKNTEIIIKQGETIRWGLNVYNDKGEGAGGDEGGEEPDPTPEPEPEPEPEPGTYTANGHTIHLDAYYIANGESKDYTLVITSDEAMSGLGGSFWNVNGVGADMRSNMTISDDKKTIICKATSTTDPNIYTPLYVLMPGEEVNFGNITLDWVDRNVTTNAPNPQMTSASEASKTQNSVTLNVASTGGNGYKVTYGGNTITTTASNGQITITGLNSGTTYNFTVYAMYDTYQSSNSITVKAKTLEVGCSGTSTTCTSGGSEFVSYKINYIGGNILFTVKSTTANQLTSCKLNYATSSSGANAVSNLPMTITNGEATYTLPATGNIASGTLYFSFTYKTGGMGSEGSTTSGWNSAFQYPIGGCALDDGIPHMQSATKTGATTSSITLDVSAVANIDGVASNTAVTQFMVSVDGAAAQTLTATNGQITINGLTANTSYNFEVWAKYNGNTSENSKTLTASTNKESECEGTRGHYNGEAVSPVNFEIDYIPSNRQLQVRLTCEKALTVRMINWTCNGTTYGMNGTHFDGDTYTYTLPEEMVGKEMYIRFEYNSGINGNRLTAENLAANDPNIIYYKVGECGCKPDDGDSPTMGAVSIASVNTTSVTLNVEGTDPSSTVSSFVVVGRDGNVANGATYYATNRKITIAGLASCQTYQWDIYAKDASCNTSANKESITVKTAAENYALNKDASFVYNENPGYTGAQVVDGNLKTRGGTQKTDLKDVEQILKNSVFTVDLGEVKMFNEIDIYWERAASTDYELQASIDNASWSTIARYTSTPKWVIYEEWPKQGEDNMIYRFYEMPARYLRVVPHTLSVADAWGMSIWEFEVYGECGATTKQCPVVLGVRAESIKAQSAVISVSAIDQQTPEHAKLTYIVTTAFTNAAGKTMTNTYTFAPGTSGRVNQETTAELTLDGLIPGANYTITVKASDGTNESCNSNSINIRTGKAEGCGLILEGDDAIETDDWLPFPDGMTYNVKLLNSDANTFDADISFINTPTGITINNVYLSVQKQYTQSDCYGGWIDKEMALQDGKYTLELKKDDIYTRKGQDGCGETLTQDYEKPLFPEWPNLELAFMVETNQGIFHTNIINYNAEMVNPADCEDYFIIFHNGSEPASDMKTQYAGGTIDKPIYYYRYVTPDQWTPLCLPFAVTAVQVYDPEDKKYYNLEAQTSTKEGSFWMREQEWDVSGELFKESWYDGTNTLPQKNTAYNFRVPSNYYENKYIIFRGEAQSIATDFTLGAASTNDDQYRLYGNTTMMPQTMVQAYKEDADGKFYRLHENWTLNPFECYVIAKGSTMARMPIIGRWNAPSITTGLENITADTMLPQISIYTTLGQPITTLYNCSLIDAQTFLLNNYGAGCYILSAQEATTKVLIP